MANEGGNFFEVADQNGMAFYGSVEGPSSISDCELSIPHYRLFRSDRDLGSGKRGGGGLITYAHDKYNFEPLENWNLCCPDLEWQWSLLHLPKTRDTSYNIIASLENFVRAKCQKLLN